MTDDLISREAAVKLLCDKADGYYMSMFATSDECHTARIVALEAANEIESIPAVDAAPVVHGRWKYFHKQNIAVCTSCSFERDLDANFGAAVSCPNCGARMDKEE